MKEETRNDVVDEVIEYINNRFEQQKKESRWVRENGDVFSCDVGYAYEWWNQFKEELENIKSI